MCSGVCHSVVYLKLVEEMIGKILRSRGSEMKDLDVI